MTIEEKNGRKSTYDKFKVEKIEYDENRQIIGLAISNQDGQRVFTLAPKKKQNN